MVELCKPRNMFSKSYFKAASDVSIIYFIKTTGGAKILII